MALPTLAGAPIRCVAAGNAKNIRLSPTFNFWELLLRVGGWAEPEVEPGHMTHASPKQKKASESSVLLTEFASSNVGSGEITYKTWVHMPPKMAGPYP